MYLSKSKMLPALNLAMSGINNLQYQAVETPTVERVRVGILHSLSGDRAIAEQSLVEVQLMAIAEINQTGGVLGKQIEPAIEDGGSAPEIFERQALKLIESDRVTAVFGGCTSATRKALLPIFEQFNAQLWYPCHYEGLECSSNIFYTGSCPNQLVEPAVSWLLENQRQKFYLLASDCLFGRTVNNIIKAQLQQQGLSVVGEEYLPLGKTDLTETIVAIAHAQPDTIFNTLKGNSTLAFYRQYHSLNISPEKLTVISCILSEVELQILGEFAKGTYASSSYFSCIDTPINRQFLNNFWALRGGDTASTTLRNRPINAEIEAAYTQIYLWKQAVELAQSFDSDRLRQAALGISIAAPSGLVRIEPNYHVSKPSHIARVLPTGDFEIIRTVSPSIKPLPWLGSEPATLLPLSVGRTSKTSDNSSTNYQKKLTLEARLAQLQIQINEQQKIEAALREYGTQLRTLFAAMSDVIVVIDSQGRYLRVAPTNPVNLDKPTEAPIGQTLYEVFPTQQADTFISYIKQALELQQVIKFEYSFTTKESHPENRSQVRLKEIWCAATFSPISTNLVIWMTRDITEQKQAEKELQEAKDELERQVEQRTAALKESNDQFLAEIVKHQQAESALRAATEQLKAILDAVPGIVSWISSDLHYLGVNHHLAKTFDMPPEAFIGKDIGFLRTSNDFKEFVREFFASPHQEAFREINATVRGVQRSYLIVAQKYDQDRAAFTVGLDITERYQVESDLRAAKDQLQAILDAVPGIVSWISSDLRYLGVNRHLAQTFNLPIESFAGKDIGFLGSGSQFGDFVQEFFASSHQEAFREISTQVDGMTRNYLVVAQKYDQDRAAFTVGIDITERRQAEEALRQAETKYRSIFENAVEGIFQTTPDGYYLSANPALARIYGYKSPEALMANITSVQRQLYVDSERRAEFIRLLHENDAVIGFESQIYRTDGRITWISENARAVRDESGNLIYYEGTVEDISERKQAEEALQRANEQLEARVEERTAELRESNQRLEQEVAGRQRIEAALRTSEAELRALFAAMTDIITVYDVEGRYRKIVSTNSEVLYSPKEERIGKTVYELMRPSEAEFFVSQIRRVLNTGQTVNLEYSLIIDEGDGERPPQEVWFAGNVSPLPDNCVIWVARNITERKRVIDAMQAAEEKYRSIFENAAEGIFQSTPDGRYLSVNPALSRMYGYTSPEEMMNHLTDVERQLYVDPLRRVAFIAALERDDAVLHFESQVYCQDGSIIWTSENARAVRDAEGKLLYFEGTVEDITKRKQAEEALLAEQEKSERLLLNILPQAIAEQLKQDQQPIADRFEEVTILFADLVDFTGFSSRISPTELVNQLNEIFSAFDQLALKHGLEKIKTIGDAYMVAGGLPTPRDDHPEAIAQMALDMQQEIRRFRRDNEDPFRLRIGINTGPVVAGVIGIKKFSYDLWGDAVNVASRMESQGTQGGIQVTTSTYQRLQDKYAFEKRGAISVKGKGKMITYWLIGRK